MTEIWAHYFKEVQKSHSKGTEMTFRTPFQNVLDEIKPDKKITITHEPKRIRDLGAPDFKIESNGATIGYIETKELDENLNKTLKSEQLKKYLPVCHNIILTNYSEFILIVNQKIIERANLFHINDLESKSAKLKEENIRAVNDLFRKFFMSEPVQISNAEEFAQHLADRGKIIKYDIFELFNEQDQSHFSKKIHGLYGVFKDTLVEDLKEEEFADAYAQTVVYCFFLAYLQSGKKITIEDAGKFIPNSFKVIREFFAVMNDFSVPHHIRWIFQEVVNLINNVDLAVIYKSMSFKNRQDVGFKDPYLHFYETFLRRYDPDEKAKKGVFYTPVEVVRFITHAVNTILEKDFQKERGYADPSVTALDFAAGTGTFLASIFEKALDSIANNKGKFQKLVREHLLKNFYGFEYLVAPYVVAHLKLSQLLKDNGYELSDDERLQVYLTDTLDHAEHKSVPLMPYLSQESGDATDIKARKQLLVITGNPPYNNKSRNNKDWIKALIQVYKPTGEKKLNLDDDYIKFIRYAHWKIKESGHGVIGIITNNSFLNGLTHRKMRGELLADFNAIYILNLHGNSRIGETAPDGSVDENVFDIKQGVSINIFARKEKSDEPCKVYYYDLFGKREDKYQFLLEQSLESIPWEEVQYGKFDEEFKATRWGGRFNEDLNFFVPMKNALNMKKYGDYWGMTEIFNKFSSGLKTERDAITIKFTKKDIEENINYFFKQSPEDIKKHFNTKDSRDWQINKAKEDIIKNINKNLYIKIFIRPFDEMWTFYTGKSKGFIGTPGYDIMKHFINKENIGLTFMRQVVLNAPYTHFYITDKVVNLKLLNSSEGTNSLAPLYLYSEEKDHTDLFSNHTNKNNRSTNFTTQFSTFIEKHYLYKPTPEEIMGYIYAVLYMPAYREKYYEYLKIDFPRVPFVKNESVFKELSSLGAELINHHLMKMNYPDNRVSYPVEGNDTIERVDFVISSSSKTGKIMINDVQYFDNISPEVWDSQIGGYQVLDKWLKSRKDRTLTYQEQETFIKICNILDFTNQQMTKIDKYANKVIL